MEYTIEVIRSRKARRASLRVTREGKVRLSIPWWGSKRRALEWAATRHEWIVSALEKVEKRKEQNPPLTSAQVEELRRVAKVKLPPILEDVSGRTGLRYRRLTIRKSHSRWGSCTREGNISLSLYLAALPDELIEFVCIHELCHTIHHNHSAEFHALVNLHTGGREKELQKKLRMYAPR